jgi:hypothetical protein
MEIMSNTQLFPHIIDGILKGLTSLSEITIIFRPPATTAPESLPASSELVSVNGFNDPAGFTNMLCYHTMTIEKVAMERQKELEPANRPAFLHELGQRLRAMEEKVIIRDTPGSFTSCKSSSVRPMLRFKDPLLHDGNEPIKRKPPCRDLELQLIPFVQAWHSVMEQSISRLVMLEMILEYIPVANRTPKVVTREKLVLRTTVSRYAILMRLFVEADLVEYSNKSFLFRLFCDYFTTPSKESISWKSIKNHFDLPDPDDLAWWQDELETLKEITLELWKRYHSN